MVNHPQTPELIRYLIEQARQNPDDPELPSLNVLSEILGSSVPKLREQLEVAKTLGLVEVRPRTGIKRLPFSFEAAVWNSLSYAISVNHAQFYKFAQLRVQVELAFWYEAVTLLDENDKQILHELIEKAESKLNGSPIRIPHAEHRELHLSIYRKLDNPFVLGILEAYWDAYESIGLSVLTDLKYLKEVWTYHKKMVVSICTGDLESGYSALFDHTDLLALRRDTYQDLN
jgi:DNA-binding FadR family transcriptional regulator